MKRAADISLILTLLKQRNATESEVAQIIQAGLIQDIPGAEAQQPAVTVSFSNLSVSINGHSLDDPSLHDDILQSVRVRLLEWATTAPVSSQVEAGGKEKRKSLSAGVVVTHFVFWLLNGLAVLWLLAALLLDNSAMAFFMNYFANFFAEFGLKMIVAFISSVFLISNPILAMLAYFSLVKNEPYETKKVWRLLFGYQVIQILLSAISLTIATSVANPGIVILLGLAQTLPLLSIGKLLLPAKVLKRPMVVLVALAWITCLLGIAGYFGILELFILPLPIAYFFQLIGSPYLDVAQIILIVIQVLLIGGLGAAAMAFPYVIFWIIYKDFTTVWKNAVKVAGRPLSLGILYGSLGLLLLSVWLGSRAPTDKYSSQLTRFASAVSFEEREAIAKELVPHEKQIEQNYLAVRNARSSYPFNRSSGVLAYMYEEAFSFSEDFSVGIDQVFLTLAFPFVYPDTEYRLSKSSSQDFYKVGGYYAELFGYQPGSRQQELGLTFNERPRVNLKKRTISAKNVANQQLVQVTIEEEYTNNSPTDEELIYEFSLPASAVITDLKLGPNLEYQGQIAPRGAARQVYEEQIARNWDPALLEQIGPSQYRLRVYPVPGTRNEVARETGNQKISFSYIALVTPEGIPLPWYSREDNISTSLASVDQPKLDDRNIKYSDDKRFLVPETGYCTRFTGISTGGGEFLRPTSAAIPELGQCAAGKWQSNWNFSGKRVALMVSVSARKDAALLKTNLKQFFENNESLLSRNEVSLIQFNTKASSPTIVTADNWEEVIDAMTLFGTDNYLGMTQLIPKDYDEVIIVASGQPRTEAFTSKDATQLATLTRPISLVYLDGPPPAMTQQFSQYLLNNGVSVVGSIEEALLTSAARNSIAGTALQVGPYWLYERPNWNLEMPKASLSYLSQDSAEVQKLVSSRLITEWLAGVQINQSSSEVPSIQLRTQVELSKIELLDYLHGIAKDQGVVTPYSSYIALVNSQQQQRLDQLSKSMQRYNESGVFNTGRMSPISPGTGWSGGSFGSASLNNAISTQERVSDAANIGSELDLNAQAPQKTNKFLGIVIAIILIIGVVGVLVLWFKRRKTVK